MSQATDKPKTADGVEVTEGLRVINSNMDVVRLTLERAFFEEGFYHGKPTGNGEWWFYDMTGGLSSESRVTTCHPTTYETPDELDDRKKIATLMDRFGSAEAVFVWADNTDTDLKSEFDLSDKAFDRLLSLAENGH